MKRLLLLCCFLPTLALAQRVVVVQGATFGGVDWKELPGVTALAVRAVPVDAAALAAQADVLVCKPDALTPAQQAAIEGFVRGGGEGRRKSLRAGTFAQKLVFGAAEHMTKLPLRLTRSAYRYSGSDQP